MSRFRVAGQAEADAQQRNEQLQRQVLQLQQQLQDQGCVLTDTKEQVCFLLIVYTAYVRYEKLSPSGSWGAGWMDTLMFAHDSLCYVKNMQR